MQNSDNNITNGGVRQWMSLSTILTFLLPPCCFVMIHSAALALVFWQGERSIPKSWDDKEARWKLKSAGEVYCAGAAAALARSHVWCSILRFLLLVFPSAGSPSSLSWISTTCEHILKQFSSPDKPILLHAVHVAWFQAWIDINLATIWI